MIIILCKNCNSEIKENSKFCIKCGSPVDNVEGKKEKESEKNVDKKITTKKENEPKKELSPEEKKKKKSFMILGLIVLLVVFSMYTVGKSMTSREKVVGRFVEALNSEDASEIAKNLVVVTGSELTAENMEPLVKLLKEQPGFKESIISKLNEERSNTSGLSKDRYRDEEEVNYNEFFVRKNGTKFLFFDKYEVVVQPYFITVESNYQNVDIFINDIEQGVYNDLFEASFGPFYPGKHIVKGVYDGDFANLLTEEDLYLTSKDYSENSKYKHVYLELMGKIVLINSNYEDGKIFINEKDTGFLVKDQDSKTIVKGVRGIGPIDESATIQIKKEFPWGEIASDKVKIEESGNSIKFNLEARNEKVDKDIVTLISKYVENMLEATESRDISKYENLVDPQYTEEKNYIESNIKAGRHDLFKMKKLMIDLDSIKIDYGSEKEPYTAWANVRYYFDYVGYYEKEGEEVDINSLEYKEKEVQYKLMLIYDKDSEKWNISNMHYLYNFGDKNLHEINYE